VLLLPFDDLIEHVEVALALVLPDHSALLQQVGLDEGPHDAAGD